MKSLVLLPPASAADGRVEILPNMYVYRWAIDNFTGNQRTNLSAGTYQVLVIDPADPACPNLINIEVEESNPLTASASKLKLPTCGMDNGEVRIEVLNGSGNYSFNWSDTLGQNVAIRNNLSSQTYTVSITDTGMSGCEFELAFELPEGPSGLATIQLDPINPICAGDINGSVNYAIQLDPTFTGPAREQILDSSGRTFTNGLLPAGEYCIEVIDNNGCLAGQSCFEIQANPSFNITANLNAADCDNDGTITLLPSGGMGPFVYDWSDLPSGDNVSSRNGLSPGNYTVSIADANACEQVLADLEILDDCIVPCQAPTISNIIIQQASCGQNNGAVQFEINGDLADYTINWSNTNSQTTSADQLAAGVYYVTVAQIANSDCRTIQQFLVGNDNGPVANVVLNNPATCNTADGHVQFSPVNYSYEWNDERSGFERTDLRAGNYIVTVTDPSNGCKQFHQVTVAENSNLVVSAIVDVQPTCNASNGEVRIRVNGGSGDYAYSWGAGNTRNDLPAGNYLVSVTDQNTGCTETISFTLYDDVPPAQVNVSTEVNLNCAGASDGTVNYTINYDPAFIGPPTILIRDNNDITYQNGNLSAGFYYVNVYDGNNCLAGQTPFEVKEPLPIQVTYTSIDGDCTNDGEISLVVVGGTSPYSYDWADIVSRREPQNRTDLSAGNYTLSVYDANNCIAVTPDILVEKHCPVVCEEPKINNVTVFNSTCGNTDGLISFEVEGHEGNYRYTWTPSVSNSNEAVNLSAGTYKVQVQALDDTCKIEIEVVVGNSDANFNVDIQTTDATCIEANGTASLIPMNYIYNWSDGQTGAIRNNLTAGIYQVTVSELSDSCFDVIEVRIGSTTPISASATILSEPSCGSNNGSVNIIVIGGSGDYDYSWGANSQRNNLAAGAYMVTVRDNQTGCSSEVSFMLENDVAGAEVTINNPVSSTTCAGGSDGSISYDVTYDPGFVQPGREEIQDENGVPQTNDSLSAGNYCVVVYDGNNCVAGQNCFVITEPQPMIANVDADKGNLKKGGSISIAIVGGVGPLVYDWADLSGTNNPRDRTGLSNGGYNLTVTDANNCQVEIPTIFLGAGGRYSTVCSEPKINNVTILNSQCGENDGFISIELEGDVGDYIYNWNPNVSNSNEAISLPAGTYTVQIQSIGEPCEVETTIIVANTDINYSINAQTTEASCGLANGSATLSPPTYLYDWSDGGNGAIRNELLAGTYQVTVSEAGNNCFDILEVNIDENSTLSATANILSEPTCGLNNGNVRLTVSGGSGSYDYSWGGSNQRNDLAAGNYNVIISDSQSGCNTALNFSLSNNVVGANINLTNQVFITCAGAADGNVTYSVDYEPGFLQPARVEILDNNGTSHTNGNLSAGNYCVVVYDGNDCIAEQTCFVVLEPLPVRASVDVINAGCSEGGSVTVNVNGGSGNYRFDWSDMIGSDDPQQRSDLTAGIYELTIYDENNCSTLLHNLLVGDDCTSCVDPVIEEIIRVEASCGQADGEIQIDMTGPVSDYTFIWSGNISNNARATNLLAGQYTVTIVDQSNVNCYIIQELSIGNSNGPSTTIDTLVNTTCGGEDGLVVISPDDLTYEWSDGGTGNRRDDLKAGRYRINVQDQSGCVSTIEINVAENCQSSCAIFSTDSLTLSIDDCSGSSTLEVCVDVPLEEFLEYFVFLNQEQYGGSVGACNINVQYTYPGSSFPGSALDGPYRLETWSVDGQSFSADFNSLAELTDLMNTWDATGQWRYIESENEIAGGDFSKSYGDMQVRQINSGQRRLIYLNENRVPLGTTLQFELGYNELIFVHRMTNCRDTLNAWVSCAKVDTIRRTIGLDSTSLVCIDIAELQGIPDTIYNYCAESYGDYVDFFIDEDELCINYTGEVIGGDTACIVVCDDLGFCDTTLVFVQVGERGIGKEDLPIAVVDRDTISKNNTIEINILENDTINGVFESIYLVSLPQFGTAVLNNDGTVSYEPIDEYCDESIPDNFTYGICNSDGCDTTYVEITVLCGDIIIYTGMSPNGDGVNDVFTIDGLANYPDHRLIIFNRWGNEVYSTTDYQNDWRGDSQGKPLPDGTYYYIFETGKGKNYNGYVQIYR